MKMLYCRVWISLLWFRGEVQLGCEEKDLTVSVLPGAGFGKAKILHCHTEVCLAGLRLVRRTDLETSGSI